MKVKIPEEKLNKLRLGIRYIMDHKKIFIRQITLTIKVLQKIKPNFSISLGLLINSDIIKGLFNFHR
jgi:hypothetical protein